MEERKEGGREEEGRKKDGRKKGGRKKDGREGGVKEGMRKENFRIHHKHCLALPHVSVCPLNMTLLFFHQESLSLGMVIPSTWEAAARGF